MNRKRVVVIGAGGFAREVKWLIHEIDRVSPGWNFVGFVVSDLSIVGERDSRSEILGDYSWLRANRGRYDALALGVGTPGARLKIAGDLESEFADDMWPSLIHPTARLDNTSAQIGHGVLICAGVLGTVNLKLRAFSMVNLGCTLGHEVEIGRGCVLNPGVNVSGGVIFEDGVLAGTGSKILQYLRVGKGATVGAGSVVTRNVPEGVTVMGIPATRLTAKR